MKKEYTANDLTGSSVSVPTLVGSGEKEAAEALNNKDLTYRIVGKAGETVTDQIPAAGTTIPGGSKVILSIWAERRLRIPSPCRT